MTTSAASSRRPSRRWRVPLPIRALWERETWLATVHAIVGFPLAIVTVVTLSVLISLLASLAVLIVTIPVMLAIVWGAVRGFTRFQQGRFAAYLDVELAPVPRKAVSSGWFQQVKADSQQVSHWRQLLHHLLIGPIVQVAGFGAVIAFWSLGFVYSSIFFHNSLLRKHGPFGWDMHSVPVLLGYTAGGVSLLLLAPWVARGFAHLQTVLAQGFLSRNQAEQIARITQSRKEVIEAADAERRRIERNLHDGAQQRLVSLAMNLGMSRSAIKKDPSKAIAAIEQAHEDAKQALAEMRDFVRGLHPAVLEDRGLDAALSGIVARSPVPVELSVNLDKRPPSSVEAVAYFVASETLTNIAKHAQATAVTIEVYRVRDLLRISITDDGKGGADPQKGSGLKGLAGRVASVDGTLDIDSPVGGPTHITVELPCA
ncbi:MAG: sensor histidine kinase [Corynebacteriales bacterium]|nr:sensor histidine kinase [Mycobacteriales bacterium]